MFSFLKASLGFLVGAGVGEGFTWLLFVLYTDRHPLPTQHLGDMFNAIGYALVAIVMTILMRLVGGIVGVVMVRRFR